MFDTLKNWFFNRDLATILQQNNAYKNQKTNTLDYKKVGIIYISQEGKDVSTIENFSIMLRKANHSNVKTLTFIDNKVEKKGGEPNCYYKNQLNWYGIPKSIEIDTFVAEHFDILFVLSTTFPSHLKYIVASSKALFKVGYNFEVAPQYFDLIIDTKDQKSVSILIDNMTKTINKIAIQK